MSQQRSSSRATVLVLVLWLLAALAGCTAPPSSRPTEAPGTQTPPPPAQPSEAAPSFKGTLKDFLAHTLKAQYISSLNLYIPPPAGMENDFYIQLNQEPAVLHLGKGVKAYAAGENGLAMGFASGLIQTFGPLSCPGVQLPGKSGVSLLSWHPDSPMLAASNEDRKEVLVFDLRHCAQVAERAFNSTIIRMAVSPKGSWLAVFDQVHTLWVGPAAGGPMTKVSSLRYETIGLAFTPQEGLLLAVDQAGWITVWAPMTKNLVDKIQVPFGPFERAEFDDRFITLYPAEGQPVRWDVPAKKVVAAEKTASPFQLQNEVLLYKTYSNRLVKKIHMRPPTFEVAHSATRKTIRIRDLDGQTRFYGLDGNLADRGEDVPDYESVPTDPDGRFQIKGRQYALGDRIFQKEHTQLNCRFIPGQGYFLWWTASARPMEFNPRPDALPVRRTLLAEEAVTWTPIESSNQLL